MTHGRIGMLVSPILRIRRSILKNLFQDGIAENLVHLRRQQTTVIVTESKASGGILRRITRFLPENINVLQHYFQNSLAEPFEKLRFIIIKEDQILHTIHGSSQRHRTSDIIPHPRFLAIIIPESVLLLLPVCRQDKALDVHAVHLVQQLLFH